MESRAETQERKEGKDWRGASENEIAGEIVDAALKVHRTLGPGLLESVCHVALAHELESRGLRVARKVAIGVHYEDLRIESAFQADLVVEGKVLVELKSVERTAPVHKKQVLTYLRLGDFRLGLLINFGAALLRDGITRLVNGLPE
jgi:GxxExxY protein